MKKVYQTIVDKGNGDCMRAVVASLLELNIEEVPHFLEFGEEWWKHWYGFWKEYWNKVGLPEHYHNYPVEVFKGRDQVDVLKNVAKLDGGFNGYFYATVASQTYESTFHAVVVDMDLNVVHDPNPNQLAMKLKPEDIEGLLTFREMTIGKTGKVFTEEEWENTTQEERDLNIYKANDFNNEKN